MNIKVTEVEWLSKDADEALVSFEANNNKYNAYGFPVDFEAGKNYDVDFGFLGGEDIPWDLMFNGNEDHIKDLIIKPNSDWSYSAYGQITSVNPVVVNCGIAELDLGYISRDLRLVGEYIYFDILRLDIREL